MLASMSHICLAEVNFCVHAQPVMRQWHVQPYNGELVCAALKLVSISITQMCQSACFNGGGVQLFALLSQEIIKVLVSGLEEQLLRMQAALDQWKTNDSVQLEAARKDMEKLKQQLEAQTESAKVASNQCKSTQTELKAVRQQLATQAAATQAGQAEIDSLRQASERKDFEIQTAELENSNRQQAQQLQKAEDEVQAMAFECRHLKVYQHICKLCACVFCLFA